MNFLPLAIDSSKIYIILAVAAIIALIFFFLKKRKSKAVEIPVEETLSQNTEATAEEINVSFDTENEKDSKDPTDDIPHIPGFVVLDGVKEQDAAVIMAITAEKTGIPLEKLDFKSIKRLNQNPVLENIEEQDAAAIMAITSNKTGIPLENLIFNSIKLVED